jgi:hypothetical protein
MSRAELAWGIVITLLLGYEGYSLSNSIPGDTLSEAVWNVKGSLLPFASGFLCGHFFWQQRGNVPKE